MAKICVIITFYNQEHFVKPCLDSLKTQTFDNFHCICVDDKSTDNTLAHLNGYADSDTRFQIISNPINQGNAAGSRNVGLDSMPECEYFMFVDGDDLLHPQALEATYNSVTSTNSDFTSFHLSYFHDENLLNKELYSTLPEKIYENPLNIFLNIDKHIASFSVCNKIYNYKLFKDLRFYSELFFDEDYLYTLQMLSLAKKQSKIDKTLYFYRRHNNNITGVMSWEKYLNSAIARLNHTYNYFITEKNAPEGFEETFKKHIALDAVRMLIGKMVKNAKNNPELIKKSQKALLELIATGKVQPKYLSMPKRIAMKTFIGGQLKLAKLFVKISS